ncbi:MAG: nicotinate (nicotinamide) nucleotide adenylyltransferase, partial [Oscillospiraceae bacterium]|nr:nicotinate (nicotinamide) nucleotide adenylyltransferase [Oscillospiraceae bacterium]
MNAVKRIGIFGGSFDPPHLGHKRAADFFTREMQLDQLLILPANAAPLKEKTARASAADRLALCRLTFGGAGARVCDWELRRTGESYTIDTLRQLQAREPGAALFLLMGFDQLLQFRRWREWEAILGCCTLVCLPREAEQTQPAQGFDYHWLKGFRPLAVSS